MSGKILSISLIVLLLGSCIGYGVGQIYSPEFIDDIIPNSFKARFEELYQKYQELSSNISASILEKGGLLEDIKELQNQLEEEREKFYAFNVTYQNLLGNFNTLQITLENETKEKEDLWYEP